MGSDAAELAPLIPEQRRELILKHLRREQVLSFNQLSALLDVSHMTIRRDISVLEEEGRALSVPGGAKIASRLHVEPSHDEKALVDSAEKTAMAAVAATLVHDAMTIYLDAGTTMLAMVPHLADLRDLTVVTNDVAIARELMDHPTTELLLVGGRVDTHNQSTVGRLAAMMLRELVIDVAFVSTSSWDLKRGVTTPAESKVEVKQAAVSVSSETVLVAASSKYGTFGKYKALDVADVDVVVSDAGLSDATVAGIGALGVRVLRA
jgi:DeoR/GlpR family transcriptional regulator of sugar metabolism